MKFLVDAQLPPALAEWLKEAGYDAEHVVSASLQNADDGAIWAYALVNDRVIITKDEDFSARSARAEEAPIIVWLRAGNTTNRVLRAWIDPRWPGIMQLIGQGHRLIEVI